MRKKPIGRQQSNSLGLALGGAVGSGFVSTIYGQRRAGSTTSLPTSKEAQLSELLSCLEKRVETLESKYLEVCDTLNSVTQRLAALSLTTINEIIIDKEKDS